MRKFLIISILTTVLLSTVAQVKVKSPTDAYSQGLYYKTIEMLEKKNKNKKEKSRFKLSNTNYLKAQCYHALSDYKSAEIFYARAFRVNTKNREILLPYSEVLMINGKFKEAEQYLELYRKYSQKDSLVDLKLKLIETSQKIIDVPTRYIVQNEKNLNTSKNDFGAKYSDNNFDYLFFSSTRDESSGEKNDFITGHKFSDIYFSEIDSDDEWMNPVKIGELVNTIYNEGTPAFNSMGTKMYFTRCNIVKHKNLGCKIFVSERETDEWMLADTSLTIIDSVSSGHPTISEDELKMYFSSTMSGGYGESDIWLVERTTTGGKWSIPENLGEKINTKGRENFPFIRTNGNLYFSSDSHDGVGGLDIFKAYKDSLLEWNVENVGVPINSTFDDFGIVFQGEDERGFLTSNRTGGKGGDDLWSFNYPPIEYRIKGDLLNEKTKSKTKNVSVRLIGTDGTYLRTEAVNGKYDFKIKTGWEYIVVAYKKNFLKSKVRISTIGLEDGKIFNEQIYLTPINEDVEIPNILYGFGSAELNDAAKKELSKLVIKLVDNPTAKIELSSHTDMVGTEEDNQLLSQERANSVFEFLASQGIEKNRIIPRGYGEKKPKVVNEALSESVNERIPVGAVLNVEYIEGLKSNELKDIANQMNRRTEFRVLSVDAE